MNEIFEAVDANAAQADARDREAQAAAEARKREEEEASRKALEEWRREQALRKKAINRRADLRFGLHVILFMLMFWGLGYASAAGMMVDTLAGGLLVMVFSWFGFQAGAWWQFRFGKGGALNG